MDYKRSRVESKLPATSRIAVTAEGDTYRDMSGTLLIAATRRNLPLLTKAF
jgi:hypothetical protein